MKMPKLFEIVLGLIFIFGILFPIPLPFSVNEFIDSALGMIVLLVATLFLFLYTNPIVGVIFVFFVYILLCRANLAMMHQKSVPILEYVSPENAAPAETPINTALNTLAPTQSPHSQTLEEEIVKNNQPVVGLMTFEETDFKPVSNPIQGSIYL